MENFNNELPSLIRVPQSPAWWKGIGGTLKYRPEDFRVEEIPLYKASGQGEHWYLEIEKKNLSTQEVIEQLSKTFEISPKEIGYAGLKDKAAVTKQRISLYGPHWCQEEVYQKIKTLEQSQSQEDGQWFKILGLTRHQNKIKTGHLKGNRFEIKIRQVHSWNAQAFQTLIEDIQRQGMLNAYGLQRFGQGLENIPKAFKILKKSRRKSKTQRFLISVLQSAAFNIQLHLRWQEGALKKVFEGDWLMKRGKKSRFQSTDPEEDQARVDQGLLVIAGWLPGFKSPPARGKAQAWEQRALDLLDLNLDLFKKWKKVALGTRRPFWIYPKILNWTWEDELKTLTLNFELPSGSYATVLADLIMG